MEKNTTRWELIGIPVIIGFGTTLHFLFAWSGYWAPVAVIAAVNESTWEHFKMAFWPGLLFGIVEYAIWGRRRRDFAVAKFLGLLAMPLITMALFYGYTAFWHHSLLADIAVFIASVAGGQFVSLIVLRRGFNWRPFIRPAATVGLLGLIAGFSLLSYFPGRNFLFAHPGTGEYGILQEYGDHDHDDDHEE